jgi:L-alanine-DL-glutamate epimerase-like enolase superfamily enzyme
MEIMVDANQAQGSGSWQPGVRWDFRRAVETARQLQALGVRWLEEPLPRHAVEQMAELRRRVELPIAAGEHHRDLEAFRRLILLGACDILQPDALTMQGISEVRKVAALCEAFDLQIVPHHARGGLAAIAQLHLVAACRQAPYLELIHDPPIADYRHRLSILRDPPELGPDGCIAMPEGPGLGVEINADLVAGE